MKWRKEKMAFANDVGTVIIVNDKDEILLLKRSDSVQGGGMWNFPGGSIEEGESEAEGASRELKEEAGLDAGPDDLNYIGMTSMGKDRFLHFFITDRYSGEVEINWESSEFVWAKVDDFDNYLFVGRGNVHPQVVEAIREFTGDKK